MERNTRDQLYLDNYPEIDRLVRSLTPVQRNILRERIQDFDNEQRRHGY